MTHLRLPRPLPTATILYAALLAAGTVVLTASSPETDERLLQGLSTNLHQLGRTPVRALVGSAFWVGGFGSLALWAALLVLVAAPVERRFGWRWAAGVFALGHVGASLLVAGGVWVGIRAGLLSPALATARDVGASYGFLAVAGLATRLLPPGRRLPVTAAAAALLLAGLVTSPSFTAVGHLLALGIGLGCAALVASPAAALVSLPKVTDP